MKCRMNKDETFELKFGLPTYDPARPSVLRNGEPCNHPGCASHISHPCEGCGRYAAGLRSGPDPQAVNNRLVELARTHATVHNVLMAAIVRGWTLEQTFGALSLLLVRENEALTNLVVREIGRSRRPHEQG